ncbi:hypothetical protein [Shewanella sp. Isolate11]|uniref:hypothetical protein n=1 Tax=Shewanella sp. Isolate11 TaxID=2908530 RepID=UPI001EFE9B6C|nr:hypothetical protein [Shewanella sp. Isolate11]MCG9697206.1 hypothetical protein [Shewanella sp. Isolate11]
MIEQISRLLVLLAAIYLIALAVVTLFKPSYSRRFLNGFASTAMLHYIELGIRLIVGAALIFTAPEMRFTLVFQSFAWVIIITSLILLLLPWRWHNKFAKRVLPPLTKRVWLFGLLSLPLGLFMLYGLLNQWW